LDEPPEISSMPVLSLPKGSLKCHLLEQTFRSEKALALLSELNCQKCNS